MTVIPFPRRSSEEGPTVHWLRKRRVGIRETRFPACGLGRGGRSNELRMSPFEDEVTCKLCRLTIDSRK